MAVWRLLLAAKAGEGSADFGSFSVPFEPNAGGRFVLTIGSLASASPVAIGGLPSAAGVADGAGCGEAATDAADANADDGVGEPMVTTAGEHGMSEEENPFSTGTVSGVRRVLALVLSLRVSPRASSTAPEGRTGDVVFEVEACCCC